MIFFKIYIKYIFLKMEILLGNKGRFEFWDDEFLKYFNEETQNKVNLFKVNNLTKFGNKKTNEESSLYFNNEKYALELINEAFENSTYENDYEFSPILIIVPGNILNYLCYEDSRNLAQVLSEKGINIIKKNDLDFCT